MTDILIVEDDKELANLMTDFLREEGYTVSSVDSGERAVRSSITSSEVVRFSAPVGSSANIIFGLFIILRHIQAR